eukprot:5134916-Amphidinium_carterae.1
MLGFSGIQVIRAKRLTQIPCEISNCYQTMFDMQSKQTLLRYVVCHGGMMMMMMILMNHADDADDDDADDDDDDNDHDDDDDDDDDDVDDDDDDDDDVIALLRTKSLVWLCAGPYR